MPYLLFRVAGPVLAAAGGDAHQILEAGVGMQHLGRQVADLCQPCVPVLQLQVLVEHADALRQVIDDRFQIRALQPTRGLGGLARGDVGTDADEAAAVHRCGQDLQRRAVGPDPLAGTGTKALGGDHQRGHLALDVAVAVLAAPRVEAVEVFQPHRCLFEQCGRQVEQFEQALVPGHHFEFGVDQRNAAGHVVDQRAQGGVALFELVFGELALGDVLQGLDGADHGAVVVEHRCRDERQPAIAAGHARKVAFGFECAGDALRLPHGTAVEACRRL